MGNNFELTSEFKEFDGEKYIIYNIKSVHAGEIEPTILLFKSSYDKLIKNKMKKITIDVYQCNCRYLYPDINLLKKIFNIVNCNCIYYEKSIHNNNKFKCKYCDKYSIISHKFEIQYKNLNYVKNNIELSYLENTEFL